MSPRISSSSRTSSPLVALHGVSLSAPDGRLLAGPFDLAFGRERTGLVGRNGVGKSTLLHIIAGESAPASGSLSRSGSIAMLRQSVQVRPGETIAAVLGVEAGLARLKRLETGSGTAEDAAEADWTLEARIADALAAVGLPGLDLDRPSAAVSGGQHTRLALAALLLAEADMILLDEPTNNLDRGGREAVARLLAGWRQGAIVVSHDRALLRGMDRIVELSSLGVRVHGGNYDVYAAQQAAEREAAARELDVAKREMRATARQIQASAERQQQRNARGARDRSRGGAPKILLDARRDRSERTSGGLGQQAERMRSAAAEALARAEEGVERHDDLAFALPSTGLAAGRTVLALEQVGFAYPGGPTLFEGFDLAITGPERVALTGQNGAGKSTLLKLAAGRIEPASGTVRRPVASEMLDQRAALLDPDQSILDNFRRLNPEATSNEAHSALARFLFRNQAALNPAGALSGGEMLRAGLAAVLGGTRPPGLLILDEPTNHLDIASVAAIEAALAEFDGALLVASHDEDFLRAIGIDRRIEFPPTG